MEFGADERQEMIIPHIFAGLASEGLIEDDWTMGSGKDLLDRYPAVPGDGIVFSPTVLGAELFLAAHGLGSEVAAQDLLTVDAEKLRANLSIPVPTRAIALALKADS
jgi:hypothetical protein